MSMNTNWFAVMVALNLVFGFATSAQDASVGVEAGVVDGILEIRSEGFQKPERPERPEPRLAGDEVKTLVSEFRCKVAELHAEQKELIKKLKNATKEERTEIREQLKANRE